MTESLPRPADYRNRVEQRARAEFDRLTRDEAAAAIVDMRALGFSEFAIAQATGLAVEQVREIIAQRRQAP